MPPEITITREQAVQWMDEAENGAMNVIDCWQKFATLSRADLEAELASLRLIIATDTGSESTVGKLQAENELLKQVEANLCELHNVALAEIESLRKDAERYRFIAARWEKIDEKFNRDGSVRLISISVQMATVSSPVSPRLNGAIDAAIAAAPKEI